MAGRYVAVDESDLYRPGEVARGIGHEKNALGERRICKDVFALAEGAPSPDNLRVTTTRHTNSEFSSAEFQACAEDDMKWTKPSVQEMCVGMEVTSYESAEIDPVLF